MCVEKPNNFFEEAEALAKLLSTRHLSQEHAAQLLGKTQSSISNKLRLLRFSPVMREQILSSGLSERHARALLRLPDLQTQQTALTHIATHALTVSETETYVESLLFSQPPPEPEIFPELRPFYDGIHRAVGSLRRNGYRVDFAETGVATQITIQIYWQRK